ncbi:hypothetical protein BD324DRAFT_178218 [Kockovaella imperatae]|uniref:SET domain-containing protein n=1 Tax=Kockovaella imperatae TaxID=4999 RepID=A0A1Y1U9R7_9TREE|nr:hypothetical protein BD324DRAFT_178218 [Kockovaella imperatae]ORX34294.1 hypothetical protein BD324DRAFT_178218 [Kockovaella imperatae]
MDNQENNRQQLQPRPLYAAEELSEDDDLCSYIFVDQLGVTPGSKLGVYPQQLDFKGPVFDPQSVLAILQETLFRGSLHDDSSGRINETLNRLSELPIIRAHLEGRHNAPARDRFREHMKRYLLALQPKSRVEIHTTSLYGQFVDRTQLAVYATRYIPAGTTLEELQGRRVPLPPEWLFDEEVRCKRRNDFSLIRSGRKGKNGDQLFLGTARFVNHDCNPNVRLEARDKSVTYHTLRPIQIGDEVLAFYGDGYFGDDNCECLCLSCKNEGSGGYSKGSDSDHAESHEHPSPAGPSRSSTAGSTEVQTPDEPARPLDHIKLVGGSGGGESAASPRQEDEADDDDEDEDEEDDSEEEDVAPRRSKREVAREWKNHPLIFRRQRKPMAPITQPDDQEEEPSDGIARCVTCVRELGQIRMSFEERTFEHHCER